ncbi:MAG: hypothetical protein ACLQVI_13305, partial [Polyangiaceae bacterium]
PFIFILLFLVGRPFGKADAARALALSLVNFGLLFVLGPRVFVEFLHAIRAQVLHPYSWAANHSIRSFVTVTWGGGSPDHGANWVGRHADAVQLGLLASVAACLLVVARRAHAQERGRISASLLLACTLGALLIPSVSDDYKLPILGPPLALYFADLSVDARDLRGIARGLLVVPSCALALAYTSTLFSYTNKPAALQNNCGALIVMLLAVTGMSFVCSRRRPEQPGEGVASASLT